MAKLHTLYDNFDNNSLATKWNEFEQSGVTVTETNQQIEIDLPNPGELNDYAELSADDTFDLEDSYAFLEVTEVPNTGTDAVGAFQIEISSGNDIWIQVERGVIYIYRRVATVTTLVTSFSYNATTHRWWRMREAGNVIYWDTSEDGISWTNRASYTHSWGTDINTVSVFIYALCYKAETAPGTFAIDNWSLVPHFATSLTIDGEGDISASPKQTHEAEVSFEGEADIIGLTSSSDIRLAQKKTYEYKVFNHETGNYITSWPDVISDYKYAQDINTPGNGIDIELARTADSLSAEIESLTTESDEVLTTEDDETLEAIIKSGAAVEAGSDADLNLDIEVWVYYGYDDVLIDESGVEVVDENGDNVIAVVGAPEGLKLFTGYISSFSARYGSSETVLVRALPYAAELDNKVIHSGDDINVPYNSYDPSGMLRAILDQFNTDGGVMTYDASSIRDTGTTVSYTFKLNTVLEGIKKILELAPSQWRWWGDVANNIINLSKVDNNPTHTFILGIHFKEIILEKTLEGLKNDYYFLGGDMGGGNILFKRYQDTTSQTNYRVGLERKTDQRFTDPTSADIVGNSFIENNSQPRYRGSITIMDSDKDGLRGYEIETIGLGQLIAFANFNNFIDDLTLQVVRIEYNPDYVTIGLDTLPPLVPKRVEDIKRNLTTQEQLEVPDAPS